VQYGRLLDIGRHAVHAQVGRSAVSGIVRALLRAVIPHRARFAALLRLGQALRWLLPPQLQKKIPSPVVSTAWPAATHARTMLVLEGCAQPALSPNTNAATARVLDRLGITLLRAPSAGCCGAVSQHLDAPDEALNYMRRNIDAWWPYIEKGTEAIIMTASGCATMVADYGHLLAHDTAYAEKATRVSALIKDISEVIAAEKNKLLQLLAHDARNPQSSILNPSSSKLAFHPPCSLQHGLKMKGRVETLLLELGFELTPVADSHLCCGSAGTYSILQPELSQRLLKNKIAALHAGRPAAIITANIGCQSHLQTATGLPVTHWIEALDARLA
jgi:glycolate oxidase iron-sulfur subunit